MEKKLTVKFDDTGELVNYSVKTQPVAIDYSGGYSASGAAVTVTNVANVKKGDEATVVFSRATGKHYVEIENRGYEIRKRIG